MPHPLGVIMQKFEECPLTSHFFVRDHAEVRARTAWPATPPSAIMYEGRR
jgi:hypothetical protein